MHTPRVRHASRAFQLVHEDGDVLVVDKAPGVLTVPTPKRERFTLVDELSRYLSKGTRITKEAFVVHRLDRETSGLLVFAKSRVARDHLMQQWHAHERAYDAVVAGVVGDDDGVIASRLVTDQRTLTRRSSSGPQADEGEEAVTRFFVEGRVDRASLLRVVLETGRRNQIRVHLKERGHPILGDDRYGGLGKHPRWDDRRLGLHARVLAFPHPRTRQPLRFDTGLPRAFASFLNGAR